MLLARNNDPCLHKLLRDQFKNFTKPEIHMNLVKGLSLWQALHRDRDARVAMGKKHNDQCQEEFASNESPQKSVPLLEPDAPKGMNLTEVLFSVFAHVRNFWPLLDWMAFTHGCEPESIAGHGQSHFEIADVRLCQALIFDKLLFSKRLKLNSVVEDFRFCWCDHVLAVGGT